ncbi:MAG TPA: YggT family protein [Acidimicrobiia bacterium]|jgi:YggT family protein|nr:YggT family protein [Acidimicrobiia bacterium]
MGIVCGLLTLAYYALIVWIILSYVVAFGRLNYDHPVRKVYEALASAVNPVLMPIRRVLPPVRIGGMGLDLSPIVLFFGILLLRSILGC